MAETEELTQLGNDIGGLEPMVTQLKSDIQKHQEIADELDKKRSDALNKVQDIEGQVTQLGEEIGRHADNADELAATMSREEEKISTMAAEMDTVKGQIDDALQQKQQGSKEQQQLMEESQKFEKVKAKWKGYNAGVEDALSAIQSTLRKDVVVKMREALTPMTGTLQQIAEQISKLRSSLQNMTDNVAGMEKALPSILTQYETMKKVASALLPAEVLEQMNKTIVNMRSYVSEMVDMFPSMDEVEDSMSAAIKEIDQSLDLMTDHLKGIGEKLGPIEEVFNTTAQKVLAPLVESTRDMRRDLDVMSSFLHKLISSVKST